MTDVDMTDAVTMMLPGHVLSHPGTKIGPGLRVSNTTNVTAIRAGSLISSQRTNHLDASFKRYTPALHDTVIAQVTSRFAEGYRVDIGASLSATLDALAFENVNRKSKPNLQVGALVYARVDACYAAMESEIVCLTKENKAGGFGVLEGGYLMTGLSLGLCRRLLDPSCAVLSSIGERVEYEVVVGMNGRIWISADDKKTLMIIAHIMKEVEFLTDGEARELTTRKLKDI